jgi:L-serine deaminase
MKYDLTVRENIFSDGSGNDDIMNEFPGVFPESELEKLPDGMSSLLGTTLGDNRVNIARLHLSRDAQTKRALVVLNTDSPVASDVLDKLRKLPHVVSVTPIKM